MSTRATARVAVASIALALSQGGSAQSGLDQEASTIYYQVRAAAVQRGALIAEGADYDRIQHITKALIAAAPEMRSDAGSWAWDVSYIRTPKENAYCLPGGKMIVTSSLVERLTLTDDELAAVMGHEMGHALLEHGKEAYEQRQVAKVAVGLLGIIAAIAGAKHHTDPNLAFNATTAVGTIGAEFLALRPYSRDRELAADKYGAELAARAGFDPRGAISLQQKLGAQGSAVEFLSTHPASDTRVQALTQFVPEAAERFATRRDQEMRKGTTTASREGPSKEPASLGSIAVVATAPSTNAPQVAQASALLPGGVEVTSVQANPSVQADPDAITGPAAASLPSKYMFSAERYAKSHGCSQPATTMTARAPTYESFEIKCASGTPLSIRCEGNSCTATE
jgi:Zn-dependent protease with chaperone function